VQKYPARRRAVAAVLRDARLRADLSQRALSAKLDEVFNYAHMIEASRQGVSVEEFIAWAKACGARPSVLMRRIEARLKLTSG
jgi:hypothetical protein